MSTSLGAGGVAGRRYQSRRTLWKPYMLSCRTKLEKLLCLKYLGSTVLANSSGLSTGAFHDESTGKEGVRCMAPVS